jgi:DNA-directed RNA polymerase specialized sigma24 family protein
VVLRHWLGLSVAETADELRIGEGTVKSHSSRGLARLRAALAADAGGSGTAGRPEETGAPRR